MIPDELFQQADDTAESVRSLCHGTISAKSIPGPVVYRLLGDLNLAAYRLGDLTDNLAAGLERSLTTHDVYDRDVNGQDRDPAVQVAEARALFATARHHAKALGDALAAAQSAIAGQGYNLPDDQADAGDGGA